MLLRMIPGLLFDFNCVHSTFERFRMIELCSLPLYSISVNRSDGQPEEKQRDMCSGAVGPPHPAGE